MIALSRSLLLSVLMVGAAAPLHAIGGCSPEYEVYSTASCSQDADCSAFSVCEDELCQPCEVLYEQCSDLCAFGWELTPDHRGGCRACACQDGGGGGIGGGTAGMGATAGTGAAGAGGGGIAGVGGSSSCWVHGDCPAGNWCDESVCAPCSLDPALDCEPCTRPGVPSFASVNECEVCECLPPNECVDDDACAPGVCAAGPLCEDGCPELQCCYGNTCVMP